MKQRCRGLTPALTATAEPLVGLGVSPSGATAVVLGRSQFSGVRWGRIYRKVAADENKCHTM